MVCPHSCTIWILLDRGESAIKGLIILIFLNFAVVDIRLIDSEKFFRAGSVPPETDAATSSSTVFHHPVKPHHNTTCSHWDMALSRALQLGW